jgi:hypothetical protein
MFTMNCRKEALIQVHCLCTCCIRPIMCAILHNEQDDKLLALTFVEGLCSSMSCLTYEQRNQFWSIMYCHVSCAIHNTLRQAQLLQ